MHCLLTTTTVSKEKIFSAANPNAQEGSLVRLEAPSGSVFVPVGPGSGTGYMIYRRQQPAKKYIKKEPLIRIDLTLRWIL